MERDFNVFLTMDEDKEDKLDEQINELENEHHHFPKIYQNLENLFKQEVPSDRLFKLGDKMPPKKQKKLSPEFHIEDPPYIATSNRSGKNQAQKKAPISPFDDGLPSSPEQSYAVKFPALSDSSKNKQQQQEFASSMPFPEQVMDMENQQQQSPFGMMQMSEMNPYYNPYQQVPKLI